MNMVQNDSVEKIYQAFRVTKKEILGLAVVAATVALLTRGLMLPQASLFATGLYDSLIVGTICVEAFLAAELIGGVRATLSQPEKVEKNKTPVWEVLKKEAKKYPVRSVALLALSAINLVPGATGLLTHTGNPVANAFRLGAGLMCAQIVYGSALIHGPLDQQLLDITRDIAKHDTYRRRLYQRKLVRHGSFVEAKRRHWNKRINFSPKFRPKAPVSPILV
jgi:hypothetical protein